MKIKLYIEGGGDSSLQDTLFRRGWSEFFRKAGLAGRMPSTFRGSGREKTFRAYQTAVRTKKANELPLLLVDSEDPVAAGNTEWQHLKTRDNWDQPTEAGDADAYLMICVMETWFLADRETMRKFFHNNWQDSAIPQWPHLEGVPKADVMNALNRATAGSGKKPYSKGAHSFDLLKEINPADVEARCPAAKRLLERLRAN